MKKILVILSILFGAILSYASLEVFDTKLDSMFWADFDYKYQVSFNMDLQEGIDENNVMEKLIDFSSANNITLKMTYGDNYNGIMFVHSNDENMNSKLPLHNNSIYKSEGDKIYSTIKTAKEMLIVNPIPNNNLTIRGFLTYDDFEDFNISGGYIAYSNTLQDLEGFISNLNSFLNKDGSELDVDNHTALEVETSINAEDHETNYKEETIETNKMLFLVSIKVLISIVIIYLVITQSKRISLMILEGNNNFEILRKVVCRYILMVWISSFLVILFSVMLFVFFTGYLKIEFWINSLMRLYIIFSCSDIITLVISLLIIRNMNIQESIKGREGLSKVLPIIHIAKIITCVAVFIPLYNSSIMFSEFIKAEVNYNRRFEYERNLYMIKGFRSGTMEHFENKENQVLDIYKYLEEHYDAFKFYSYPNKDENITYLYTDINYLKKTGLDKFVLEDESYFISNKKQGCDVINQAAENKCFVIDDEEDLLNFDAAISLLEILDGFYPNDLYVPGDVLIQVDPVDGFLSNTLFTFPGNLSEAKEMLKKVHADNGINVIENVSSFEDQTNRDRINFLMQFTVSMMSFIVNSISLILIIAIAIGITG